MDLIISGTTPQTMTSREIAEIVGSPHESVLKTVRRLIAEGIVSGNDTPYIHPQNGRQYPEFQLDYRNTMVVASGYSAEIRARIIDRWMELESAAAPRVPQTMAQALRLAAEQAELIEQQQAQLALAAPKVEFVDRYVDSTSGSKGFREVAKLLRIKENTFRAFLFERKIMYRLHGRLTAYADHLEAGRFEVKTGTAQNSDHAYNETLFTQKGIAWVAGLLASHRVSQQVQP